MAQAAWAMLMLETEGSSADPSDLNSSGCYLREAGRAEAARSAFLLAAAGGDPNALASLTWPMVLADRMHESIADFENYADAVTRNTDEFPADAERRTHLRWARANAWSNAGLAFLATGQQDRALELWKQAAVVGHVEARVYPAVLAWRQGDRSKAFELLANRIESYEVMEFAADMCEVLQEGTGWFLDWASDALDLVVSQPDADSLLVNNVAQARFAATQDDGALIEAVWSPARCGVPPAVASLVLRLRRRGETRASVEAFEECEPAMQAYVEALPSVMPESDSGSFIPKFRGMFDEQVTEARTEAGVSYVLLGRVDEAERLWRDPGARWFPEALLWRAILCLRAGKVDDAGTLIRRLLPAHRDLLERRLDHWIQNCSQEPERRWYQEGRDALLRIPGVGRPWTT